MRKVQGGGRQRGGGRWLDGSRGVGVPGRACLFTDLTLVKASSFPPRLYRLSRLPSVLSFEGRRGPTWGEYASISTIRCKGERPKLQAHPEKQRDASDPAYSGRTFLEGASWARIGRG